MPRLALAIGILKRVENQFKCLETASINDTELLAGVRVPRS